MKKILSNLPTQSLIYFVVCGVGIVVFIFLIIIPSQRTSVLLDEEIVKLGDRIEEQRILKPLFESLLKSAKNKNPTELPLTPKAKLAYGEIGNLSDRLQAMASNHNLRLQEIKTDFNAVTGNSGYLMMSLNVTGDFMQFRDFMIELGTIPSLEHIEEIQIRAIEASREIKLKIWLAQK